ncbi:MAG: FAD-dependent oxidoreductase, partial [Planctomycetes bacterium]|nr:FAD-dependent oxidoreductase [Planctomycetota bacterium]
TTGGVANFSSDPRGLGEVFDEILANLKSYHALGPLRNSMHNTVEQVFDHEILALILQEMLLKRKVKMLLHTRFVDAVVRNGSIEQLIICGQSGPEALQAKVFIDCTGEAQVAHASGFATMKGRDSDGLPMGMSLMAFVRHVTPEQLNDPEGRLKCHIKNHMIQYAPSQIPEGAFEPFEKQEDMPRVSLWPNGPHSSALKIKVPGGYDPTDTESITAAEIKGRQDLARVLDFYQRKQHMPWILDHVSPIIGIREGRRIVGDYVLNVDDVRSGRQFDDGVARGTYCLDLHPPDNSEPFAHQGDASIPPYLIPLRSLIARDGHNLLMAGRCLSADTLALSAARVSPAGAMMGQAAGITAALAATSGKTIRTVSPESVRKLVLERGADLSPHRREIE